MIEEDILDEGLGQCEKEDQAAIGLAKFISQVLPNDQKSGAGDDEADACEEKDQGKGPGDSEVFPVSVDEFDDRKGAPPEEGTKKGRCEGVSKQNHSGGKVGNGRSGSGAMAGGAGEEEASERAAEVSFPTDPGSTRNFGGEHGIKRSSVKEDDQHGEKNGLGCFLIDAGSYQKSKVAKDDRACPDVDRAALTDEQDEESGHQCRHPGYGDEVLPSVKEDSRA